MHRTRFRPTTNGSLHIGGAYVAYKCWEAARLLNGEFVLIEDDVGVLLKYGSFEKAEDEGAIGRSIQEIGEEHVEDLEWLGIAPDAVHWASEFSDAHREAVKRLGIAPWEPEGIALHGTHIIPVTGPGFFIDYRAWDVAGRVSDDHELGITAFDRGADLLSEAQLYDYFARTLYGVSYEVRQQYHPLVFAPGHDYYAYAKSKPLADGSGEIRRLRELGMDGEYVHEVLGRDRYVAFLSDEWNKGQWRPTTQSDMTGSIALPEDFYAEIQRLLEAEDGPA